MAAQLVVFGHNVEEEGFDVVVERFGSEEQLSKQAEVLAVHRVLAPVDFKDSHGAFAIDFIARGMLCGAFKLVTPGHIIRVHIFETEFADIEKTIAAVLFRIRSCVPGFDLMAAEIDALDFTGWTRELLMCARGSFSQTVALRKHPLVPGFFGFAATTLELMAFETNRKRF